MSGVGFVDMLLLSIDCRLTRKKDNIEHENEIKQQTDW